MVPEFRSIRYQLEGDIGRILSNTPSVGKSRRREFGYEVNSALIEKWLGRYWQSPGMHVTEQAQVTLVSADSFSSRPFLQPWREKRYHPGFKQVLIDLQYRQGGVRGQVPITLILPEDSQSEADIFIGSNKPFTAIKATAEDVYDIRNIIFQNRWG